MLSVFLFWTDMLRISVVTLCLICATCCVLALPHCEKTEIPKRLLLNNVINIVYTMESSCKVCVQQASRLPRLKRYLERKGIRTHFIVGVSHSADRLSGLVPHIQVNSRHVWRALGEQNNHFYVIDRCGRLVYEIINPWSNLNFTFVKAAIATTAHSHPCGLCPVDYSHVPQSEEIEEFPALERTSELIPEKIAESPLKVHVRLRHTHKGDPNVYQYVVKVAGLPDYHGHIKSDQGTPRHTTSRVIPISRTEMTTDRENLSDFVTRESRIEEQTNSPISTSSIAKLAESSTLMSRISQSIESSTTIDSDDLSTVESSTTASSITYSLNTIHEKKASTASLNLNLNQRSKSSQPINITAETITEQSQKDNSENNKGHSRESTKTSNDYEEDYVSIDRTKKVLTEDEHAEFKNLKVHYGRILDWMNFFNDDYYY